MSYGWGNVEDGALIDPAWAIMLEAALGNGRLLQKPDIIMQVDTGPFYYARDGSDGTIDSGSNYATLLQGMIQSLTDDEGGVIAQKPGRYFPDNTVTLKHGVFLTGYLGDWANALGVRWSCAHDNVAIAFEDQTSFSGVHGMAFAKTVPGSDYAGTCIDFSGLVYGHFKNLVITKFEYGLYADSVNWTKPTTKCSFKNIRSYNVHRGIHLDQITDLLFEGGVYGQYASANKDNIFLTGDGSASDHIVFLKTEAQSQNTHYAFNFDKADFITLNNVRMEAIAKGIWVDTNSFNTGKLLGMGVSMAAGAGADDINGDAGYAAKVKLIASYMPNFKNENSGFATILNGTAFIDVPHGLEEAPAAQDIHVYPNESIQAASFWFVDTITATDFRINLNANPGANITFPWAVRRPS